jgi:hypothetical protein
MQNIILAWRICSAYVFAQQLARERMCTTANPGKATPECHALARMVGVTARISGLQSELVGVRKAEQGEEKTSWRGAGCATTTDLLLLNGKASRPASHLEEVQQSDQWPGPKGSVAAIFRVVGVPVHAHLPRIDSTTRRQ